MSMDITFYDIVREYNKDLYKVLKGKSGFYDNSFNKYCEFIRGLVEFDPLYKVLFGETKKRVIAVLIKDNIVKHDVILDKIISDEQLVEFLSAFMCLYDVNKVILDLITGNSDEYIRKQPLTTAIAEIVESTQRHMVRFNKYLSTVCDEEIEEDIKKYDKVLEKIGTTCESILSI